MVEITRVAAHPLAFSEPFRHGNSHYENSVYGPHQRSQLESAISDYLNSQKALDRIFCFGIPVGLELLQDALRCYFFGGKIGEMYSPSDISEMFQIRPEGARLVISDVEEILQSSPEFKYLMDLRTAAAKGASELEAFHTMEKAMQAELEEKRLLEQRAAAEKAARAAREREASRQLNVKMGLFERAARRFTHEGEHERNILLRRRTSRARACVHFIETSAECVIRKL